MIIRYFVESSWLRETDGQGPSMTVYLPPNQIDDDWRGVLSYDQEVTPDSEIEELRARISFIEAKLAKAKGAYRSRLEKKLATNRALVTREEQWQGRWARVGPKEAMVVLPGAPYSREKRSVPLRPDHVGVIRAAVSSLTITPGAGLMDDQEPVEIMDGGRYRLFVETHCSRLELSIRSGGSGWSIGGRLIEILNDIWKEFDGDSALRRPALLRR